MYDGKSKGSGSSHGACGFPVGTFMTLSQQAGESQPQETCPWAGSKGVSKSYVSHQLFVNFMSMLCFDQLVNF